MSVRDVFGTDLALLHAPSVYDFRTSVIMHGPIVDAVPSTNEFEMYPVGLTSITSYLSANQFITSSTAHPKNPVRSRPPARTSRCPSSRTDLAVAIQEKKLS